MGPVVEKAVAMKSENGGISPAICREKSPNSSTQRLLSAKG